MNEFDLIHMLSNSSSRKEDGEAFLKKLKTAAGPAAFLTNQLKQNKQRLIDTAIGGGVISGISYARSRKNKVTGQSRDQVYWNKALTGTEKDYKNKLDSGQKLTYGDKIKLLTTKGHKGQADIARDHPIEASLRAGAMFGIPAGLAGRFILKRIIKKG